MKKNNGYQRSGNKQDTDQSLQPASGTDHVCSAHGGVGRPVCLLIFGVLGRHSRHMHYLLNRSLISGGWIHYDICVIS